ncbi:hypothetical protein PIB30_056172 [Stylosanthes scabra]|uniref:Uncharacterized protein n=1 Tax=Stylosanthes scabra TaxID=79078 RepID=A0ABU6RJ81_9FABA|nr:hypothetical protein [Stylosanthes scabra]
MTLQTLLGVFTGRVSSGSTPSESIPEPIEVGLIGSDPIAHWVLKQFNRFSSNPDQGCYVDAASSMVVAWVRGPRSPAQGQGARRGASLLFGIGHWQAGNTAAAVG